PAHADESTSCVYGYCAESMDYRPPSDGSSAHNMAPAAAAAVSSRSGTVHHKFWRYSNSGCLAAHLAHTVTGQSFPLPDIPLSRRHITSLACSGWLLLNCQQNY